MRDLPKKTERSTNSARWLQWKNAALPPPGDARLDQDIVAQIFLRVRELYQKDGGKFPDPILNLTWAYTDPQHPSLAEVAKEINGKALADLTDPKTQADDQGRPTIAGLCLAEGRRHHVLRQLDLLRLVDRSGQPDSCAAARTILPARNLPELGVVVAGESPRPLQPRFLRPGRKPWDPSRGNRSGGTKPRRSGWATMCPILSPIRNPKDHMGPFIMNPEGVGRLFVPLGAFAGWTVPGTLRADRKPDRKPAAPAAIE